MKTVDTIAVPVATEPFPPAVQRAIDAIVAAPVAAIGEDWHEDHGYAENDHTSVWIERVGEAEFV